MRHFWVLCMIATGIQIHVIAHAAEQTSQSKTSDEIALAKLKLETEQALYIRNLELEKVKVERMKAWINGASLMVPLMVAAGTLSLGVWNQNQQAKLQREAQAVTERAEFELKATEVVLSANGPISAKNRAKALESLFPSRLPKGFASTFNPDEFDGPKVEFFEAKKIFFEAAALHAPNIKMLAALWKQLFPWDQWPEQLDAKISNAEDTEV